MRPTPSTLRPLSLVVVTLLTLLAACQSPTPNPAASTPNSAPQTQAATPPQAEPYRIREDLSDVRFLVYRAGPLARLGHNHVIQARRLQGQVWLAPEFRDSTMRLVLPVAGFVVDNAEARHEEGADFSTEPDEDAIAGTRRNMLGEKVLDAGRYPEIVITSTSITGPEWQPDIGLRIRLHGVERELSVPVALDRQKNRLIATAAFTIRQSDFGITPLAVLGGGLQVADAVRVRLRLIATKD